MDWQKAQERVPEAAVKTLETHWCPSRVEGVRAAGWERLGKSASEKPQSKGDTTIHGPREESAGWRQESCKMSHEDRGSLGRVRGLLRTPPETQLSGNMEGQLSNLGNLGPFHRKGVCHPAAVPGSDRSGDIHSV